ncbi:GNAT family N-acetyltransferase [Aciduricibacillus chroicocephali]|uniref:GNAT family N-acetyltransferase n=1 Tax=Aciduricibacillus chroicocephali TaxID=3054939 RepID=A0ABY9KXL8_9BACI|nr:GNAT family N-acetyltransferase [Bacillaceae bacterium 44XB]
MNIRIAEAKDAKIIHDLMIRAFTEYKNMPASSSALDETEQSVANDLNNGERAMISYMDGVPCGVVRFELKEDALYFFRLSVAPEFQRRGVARALLAEMEDYALMNGLQKIQCKVRMNMEKNMKLYMSAGYAKYNQSILELNGVSLDVAWMEKELTPVKEGTSDLPVLNA